MKIHSNAIARVILFLCCVAMMAGGAAPGVFRRSTAGVAPDELAIARAQWAASGPARYRLLIEERAAGVICRQDAVIQNEQIVALFQNTCDHRPWTITALFRRIEQDLARNRLPLAGCVVSGCACSRAPTVQAMFDPQLGYPRQRRAGIAITTNWVHRDFWVAALQQHQLPDCDFAIDREVLIASVRGAPL